MVKPAVLALALVLAGEGSVTGQQTDHRLLTVQDILKLPVPAADHRIPYGNDPHQFGDLRLPKGAGPFPAVIVIHGGCWMSAYSLDHIASLSAALTSHGIATWTLEYRRVGDEGGGWPGTFQDVARGSDYVRELARSYPLDLGRVVAIGHSAGGHLALWLAGRHRLPKKSALYSKDPLMLRGVVSLAGIPDLRRALERQVCGEAVSKLLGGEASSLPERYQQTSPIELLPLALPQRLVHGARDTIVPLALSRDYKAAARQKGDDGKLITLKDAGHFELIVPGTPASAAVEDAVLELVGLARPRE